jgi:hypothetical protein
MMVHLLPQKNRPKMSPDCNISGPCRQLARSLLLTYTVCRMPHFEWVMVDLDMGRTSCSYVTHRPSTTHATWGHVNVSHSIVRPRVGSEVKALATAPHLRKVMETPQAMVLTNVPGHRICNITCTVHYLHCSPRPGF